MELWKLGILLSKEFYVAHFTLLYRWKFTTMRYKKSHKRKEQKFSAEVRDLKAKDISSNQP